jgi:putative tryptophan/tyrosine transport system substrate-binding protein
VDRRQFIASSVALLAAPVAAQAQQARKTPRVAFYATSNPREWFGVALRELGWNDGQNIVIEWHNPLASDADQARPETLLADLVKQPVDVAVVGGPHLIRAALNVTKTVPLVGIDLESDPVANGFVHSLARPGMNLSGIWPDLPELAGKQLQFLRELSPTLKRLAVLWDDQIGGPQLAQAQSAAKILNITVYPISLRRTTEIDEAWNRVLAERPQAILALTAPVVFQGQARIADLARGHRLPSICPFSTYAERGGLMAYGPDFPTMWRQTASYVDRVLRGARISELPVERPLKFVLNVNSKTAKALGLTIPPSLLLQADQVIE